MRRATYAAAAQALLAGVLVGLLTLVVPEASARTDAAAEWVPPDYCAVEEMAEQAPAETVQPQGGTWLTVDGSCYDWSVEPPYTGAAYETEEEAAAQDPPPPTPVTPALPTWRNLYDWPNGHGYVGWHSATSSSLYGLQSAVGGQHGLWIWPIGGDYPDGGYAEWTYTAPGTTRIANVQLNFAYRNKLLAHHCIAVGLRTGSTVIAQSEWCTPAKPPDSQRDVSVRLVDPSSNPTSKVLFFRVRMDCKNTPGCTKHVPSLDPLTTAGSARLKFADMVLVDDDNPVVTLSGPFWDKRYDYINGRDTYDLTVTSSDGGSGITRGWVDRIGSGELFGADAPCDPTHHTPQLDNRICPQTFAFTRTVDPNPFPEGINEFVAKARDVALNVGESETWHVKVDRTPPARASRIELQYFDPATSEASIIWDVEGRDPDLPGGIPGSGVAREEFRYRRGAADWSTWLDVDTGGLDFADAQADEQVAVELRSWDGVGNSGTGSAGTVVIVPKEFVRPAEWDATGTTPPDAPNFDDVADVDLADDPPFGFFSAVTTHENVNASGYAYDGRDARAYAYRWVGRYHWPKYSVPDTLSPEGYNPAYIAQTRGGVGGLTLDCANFVSQALRAGGMTMTSPRALSTSELDNHWWADRSFESIGGSTYSWKNAVGFIMFMRNVSHRFQQIYPRRRNAPESEASHPLRQMTDAEKARLKVGDVIMLDLDIDDRKHVPSHTTLITKTPSNGGQFALTYHTANTLNKPLWYVMKYSKPEYVWVLRVRARWAP